MKITVAKSGGFCFGVKRALKIALEAAQKNPRIEMLGDIVHNEDVVNEIKKAGIKRIFRLRAGKNTILLIRAHGAPKRTFHEAARFGYKIIDATCPMVKEIHTIARKAERSGCRVIIIGDKKHDEVKGIIGNLGQRAMVIDTPKNIPLQRIQGLKNACAVTQSTQNIENVLAILAILQRHIKNLKFYNTICNPTKIKQREAHTMPLENDVMIIVGSRHSANTKRLYEISRNLNKRSFWIQSRSDIQKKWFTGATTVGITAGASTPDTTTHEVIKAIRALKK